MMKAFKKIFVLVLALVMAFGMGTTVKAADEDNYDQPLTITGLTDGDVAKFYHIVEWVNDAEDNVKGWKAVAPFDTVLTKDVLTAVLVGTPAVEDDPATPDVDETKPKVDPTGITAELAGQLAKAITSSTTSTNVTAADGKAVLQNKDFEDNSEDDDFKGAGLYMALITPIDPDTVYNPVFVAADFNKDKKGDWAVTEAATYADEAAAKKSTVGLDKTASTDETASSWADKKWTTVAIGDTVSFVVDTTLPAYGLVYTNPTFILKDKLTDLALIDTTLKVYTVAADGTEAELTTGFTANPVTASGYTITFAADYLKTISTPTKIRVKYDAIVTTTAPVHVNTEKNEVSTEFSNDPSNENNHGFKKDITNHYTFTLDAEGLGGTTQPHGTKTSEYVKVALDANGDPVYQTTTTSTIEDDEQEVVKSPLAGAEFKLYTDEDCTIEYVPKKADGTPDTAKTFVTEADGRFTIAGLDGGTYYLKETKAPAGFVKDTNAHKIEIKATVDENVSVTEWTKDGNTWISDADYATLTDEEKNGYQSYTYTTDVLKKYEVFIDGNPAATYNFENVGPEAEIIWTEEEPIEVPSQLVNTQGVELPSTGGIGTTMFYIFGGLLVMGASLVLITRRRMNA